MKFLLVFCFLLLLMPCENLLAGDADSSEASFNFGLISGLQFDEYNNNTTTLLEYGLFAGLRYKSAEAYLSYENSQGYSGFWVSKEEGNLNLMFYPFRRKVLNVFFGAYAGYTHFEQRISKITTPGLGGNDIKKTSMFQTGIVLGSLLTFNSLGGGIFVNTRLPLYNIEFWAFQLGFKAAIPI